MPKKIASKPRAKLVEANQRRVYIVLNKPPEVVSTMADPEGRKTLRNCLKGLPERVYPVGRLDYDASGLVFLTNDGDLAAEMLKDWPNLQQHYHVKIKGRLMMDDLERLGRNADCRPSAPFANPTPPAVTQKISGMKSPCRIPKKTFSAASSSPKNIPSKN